MFRKSIITFFYYAFIWFSFFSLFRFIFLVYNIHSASLHLFNDWLSIFFHGSILDFAITGYILILPSIFFLIRCLYYRFPVSFLTNLYTIMILGGVSLFNVANMEVYTHWNKHLGISDLGYLLFPREVMLSLTFGKIFILLLISLSVFFLFFYWYSKSIHKRIQSLSCKGWKYVLPVLFLIAASIYLLRGGFGIVNTGTAYFHYERFPNHAAVNPLWNMGSSIKRNLSGSYRYHYFNSRQAKRLVQSLFEEDNTAPDVIQSGKPNIILIIMESFSSHYTEIKVENKEITPCFNSMAKEGIRFKHCFSNGVASANSLPSILCGYPSVTGKMIILYPGKTETLNFLNKELKKYDYSSAFYHGSDINFAYFKSFLVIGQFDRIVSVSDFPGKDRLSQWGVPDHIVFDRLFRDIENTDPSRPFFNVIYTISNHPPFDVPMKPVFSDCGKNCKQFNAAYYADWSLGQFISRARQAPWWKNTWIIIVSDHGVKKSGKYPNYSTQRFHIPMLWTGGALMVKDTVVSNYCSQSDIAGSMLYQLGLSVKPFPFSHNVLSKNKRSYAFYTFDEGFGIISEYFTIAYDCKSKHNIISGDNYSDRELVAGKAFLQVLYDDFLNR